MCHGLRPCYTLAHLFPGLGVCVMLSGMTNSQFHEAMDAYERQDFQLAFKLFRRLAIGGDARAQCMLGFMYCDGEGVQQNYLQAYAWITCSASQDLKEAVKAKGLLEKLIADKKLVSRMKILDILDKRVGMERRCGYDRREGTELEYFARGGSQRRRFVERRNTRERRTSRQKG